MSVCCVKPCPANTDIFMVDKCYPRMGFGESCEINEQCKGGTQAMMCLAFGSIKECSCPPGYINVNGYCTQPYCTSNPGRSPWKDANSKTRRCSSPAVPPGQTTVSCPTGYTCDQTFGICCPDFNIQTCPGTHKSSGGQCASNFDCTSTAEDICYKDPNIPTSLSQMGVCCTPLCPANMTPHLNSVCSASSQCTLLYGQHVFCYGTPVGVCCSK